MKNFAILSTSLIEYSFSRSPQFGTASVYILQALSWIIEPSPLLFRICEIVHTAGVDYEVYRTTIIYDGRPDLLVRFKVMGAVSAFGALITLLVQVRRQIELYPLVNHWRLNFSIGFLCDASHQITPAAIQ